MAKSYRVRFREAERTEVEAWGKTGQAAARNRLPAQSRLPAEEGAYGPAWTEAAIRKAWQG